MFGHWKKYRRRGVDELIGAVASLDIVLGGDETVGLDAFDR